MRKIGTCFALLFTLMPAGAGQALASPEGDAVAVVRHYYRAINAHHYRTAFKDWDHADSGVLPTGQTFTLFKRGFRDTAGVTVKAGPPGEIEGAMGSSYIEVPVTVRALSVQGAVQVFKGRYTLRRSNLSVADGVTPDEQHWHLYSAHPRRVP